MALKNRLSKENSGSDASGLFDGGKPAPPKKKAPYVKGPPVAAAALDLGPFESAEALEELGLDRLQRALMAAGRTCGGTLRDRAERLLSTRGKDRADWDPKILAKPKKKG